MRSSAEYHSKIGGGRCPIRVTGDRIGMYPGVEIFDSEPREQILEEGQESGSLGSASPNNG